MVNGLSQYNTCIAFRFHKFASMWSTLQYLHLLDSIFTTWYIEHGIYIYIYIMSYCSWFKILSQYDASIAFLLHFGMVMQYPFDSLNQNNLAHGV